MAFHKVQEQLFSIFSKVLTEDVLSCTNLYSPESFGIIEDKLLKLHTTTFS